MLHTTRIHCIYSQESNWSETGDRYLLKLFRDFVFHQTAPPGHDAEGGPLMDWGHVIETLNKVGAMLWWCKLLVDLVCCEREGNAVLVVQVAH